MLGGLREPSELLVETSLCPQVQASTAVTDASMVAGSPWRAESGSPLIHSKDRHSHATLLGEHPRRAIARTSLAFAVQAGG